VESPLLSRYIQKDVRHEFLRISLRIKLNAGGDDIHAISARYVEELGKKQISKCISQMGN